MSRVKNSFQSNSIVNYQNHSIQLDLKSSTAKMLQPIKSQLPHDLIL